MPLSDRNYMKGNHPPYCTCVDCVNKRLGIVKRKEYHSYRNTKDNHFSKQPQYTTNKNTEKEYPGCIRAFSSIVLLVILFVFIGVIGGGIYGISKYHGNIGDGISSAYTWIADGVINTKDKVVNWFSLISTEPETNVPIATSDVASSVIQTATKPSQTTSSLIDKVTDSVSEFVSPSTDISDYVTRFNEYRQSQGRTPLVFSDDLNKIAELRLTEIQDTFSHSSKGNYNNHLAENIVMGIYSNQGALECWQGSPGHNANMIDRSYKYTGYAIGGGYAVQVFTKYETINGEPQLPPGWYWSD
jgi:uncharacterized protein YkwD